MGLRRRLLAPGRRLLALVVSPAGWRTRPAGRLLVLLLVLRRTLGLHLMPGGRCHSDPGTSRVGDLCARVLGLSLLLLLLRAARARRVLFGLLPLGRRRLLGARRRRRGSRAGEARRRHRRAVVPAVSSGGRDSSGPTDKQHHCDHPGSHRGASLSDPRRHQTRSPPKMVRYTPDVHTHHHNDQTAKSGSSRRWRGASASGAAASISLIRRRVSGGERKPRGQRPRGVAPARVPVNDSVRRAGALR